MNKPSPEKAAFWRTQVEKAKTYDGSNRAFCALEGLSYSSFVYWKKKLKGERGLRLPGAFARVEVVEDKRCHLPDPEWLADFVLALHGGSR